MWIRGTKGLIALCIAGAACGSPGAARSERGGGEDLSEASAPDSENTGSCPLPDLRPTYLPWLTAGEPVPNPDVSRFDDRDSDASILTWSHEGGSRPYEVAIVLQTQHHSEGGETVDIEVEGRQGEMLVDAGEGTTFGNAEIRWDLWRSRCNDLRLWLTSSGRMSSEEAETQILRIARSLQPAR
jgi:hypothetical protein